MLKYYLLASLIAVSFVGCSSSVDGEITCTHNSRIIKCVLKTAPTEETRKVDYFWKSPNSPTDDRNHTNALVKNHASVFDGRYTRGRAKGTWEVTATMDEQEYKTTFTLE